MKNRGQRDSLVRRRAFGRGFTLVELMVVILIIGILSSLLLTAIGVAWRHVKRAETRQVITNLEAAWTQYLAQYRQVPGFDLTGVAVPELQEVAIDGNVAKMLQGDTVVAGLSTYNPKKLVFMQFGRVNRNGTPITPWGDRDATTSPKEHQFFCKMDSNFDNIIKGTGDPAKPPVSDVRRRIVVWAVDPDKPVSDPERVISSWE